MVMVLYHIDRRFLKNNQTYWNATRLERAWLEMEMPTLSIDGSETTLLTNDL